MALCPNCEPRNPCPECVARVRIPQRWAVARVQYSEGRKHFCQWKDDAAGVSFFHSEGEAMDKARDLCRSDPDSPVLILAVHRMVQAKPIDFEETPVQ